MRIDVAKYIGKEVYVKINRPIYSSHPKYPDHIYLINHGFVPDTISGDGEELERDIIEYIYYYYKRIKSAQKGMSPVQYRIHSLEVD